MKIKKISLCQCENGNYNNLPRSLDNDYAPLYDFKYPFSFNIALDCERIVFKLAEYQIESEFCRHLNVTFVDEKTYNPPELTDFIAFNQRNMRFVNVFIDASEFNRLDEIQKRKVIFDSIVKAIKLISTAHEKGIIEYVCDSIYSLSDNTECIWLKKSTKKYTVEVRFKSSLKGYTAMLFIEDNLEKRHQENIIFENGSFADLEYRFHKIQIKNNICTISPKHNNNASDSPISINISI